MGETEIDETRRHTFAGGRGNVLLIQANTTTYGVHTPAGMNTIATYLATRSVVAAATTNAVTAPYSGSVTWR